MNDEALVIVPIPALVDVLRWHETEKGAPLTEAEVIEIRGKAVCMALPATAAISLAQSRGYADISLEDPWNEWQEFRRLAEDREG